MKVTHLKIKNILGIEEAEIVMNPTGVTCISGSNGSGKTSRLEAVKSLFDGGYDATLIRNGAESGEVVMVLDDNTKIRKTLKVNGRPDLKVSGPDGLKSKIPPKTFLDMLVDNFSVDPVRFMLAKPKERVEILLQAVPLKVTPDHIKAITGKVVTEDDCEGHALQVLDTIRTQIYNERTGINSRAEEKQKYAEGILKDLPEQDADVVSNELTQKYERQTEIIQVLEKLKDEIGTTLESEKKDIEESATRHIESLDEQIAGLQQKINALQLDRQTRKAGVENQILQARQKANDLFAARKQPLDEEIATLASTIARLEQVSSELERGSALRETSRKNAEEADLLKQQSSDLTKAIQEIDKLKADLANQIPIPGLQVINEGKQPDLFMDGVPFDRLNKASQVNIALRVAKLRAGDLPLILMDNAECLDRESFAAFEAAAKETGLQFLVTRVTDGPLRVN